MKTREHLVWAGAVIGSIALIGAITNAGDLAPPAGGPEPTMHTLNEIYDATAVSAFGSASAVPSAFGGPAYVTMRINGGDIQGEDIVEGNPDVTQVYGFFEGIARPFNPASGAITGDRQHEPIRFTKRVDKSTPLIIKALTNTENVDFAEFRFFRPDPSGQQNVHYFTILLEDGAVVKYELDTTGSTNPETPPTECVEIIFQRYTWTYEDGGVEHTDDWAAPPA